MEGQSREDCGEIHTWEEKLGKGRESWVLVKMGGKEKQSVGWLMKKEN